MAGAGGRRDFAWVELISWVEKRLDSLKLGVEHRPEMMWDELGPKALSVLAPEQAPMAGDERSGRVGGAAAPLFVFGIFRVERRSHMQTANVDVTEHAVPKTLRIEDRSELAHVRVEV